MIMIKIQGEGTACKPNQYIINYYYQENMNLCNPSKSKCLYS